MKKSYLAWSIVICLLVFCYFIVMGFRFTKESAIKVIDKMQGEINILSILKSEGKIYAIYGYSKYPNYIGASQLKKGLLGLMWRNERPLSYIDFKEGMPFKTGCNIDESKRYFMLIKVIDPRIKYISIGTTEEDYSKSMNDYENRKKVSLDEAKKYPDIYQYEQISKGYAVFIGDNFNQAKYTVRAFDENGKLIADEFYGGGVRYIE